MCTHNVWYTHCMNHTCTVRVHFSSLCTQCIGKFLSFIISGQFSTSPTSILLLAPHCCFLVLSIERCSTFKRCNKSATFSLLRRMKDCWYTMYALNTTTIMTANVATNFQIEIGEPPAPVADDSIFFGNAAASVPVPVPSVPVPVPSVVPPAVRFVNRFGFFR